MLTKRLKLVIPVLLMTLGLFSCVEKYWPDIDEKYLELLVVDGMITNEPGPYTIRISNSSSVNGPKYIPLSNYQVEIADDQGNSETLSETETGVYKTNPFGIQGVVGRRYKLIIRSQGGESYESNYQTLKAPVEIENVYARIESKPDTSLYYDLQGYQFYVDSKPFTSDTNYILYKLQQTYEYTANEKLGYLYYNRRFHQVLDQDSLGRCWRTTNRDELFTFKSTGSKGEKISELPLHYVSTQTKELSNRYSLLVQQLTVNSKTYKFFNGLNDQNSGEGSFYNQQPYQLGSNIRNIDDPNEVILGYFNVAGISVKRIFLDKPVLVFKYNDGCFLNYEDVGRIRYTSSSDWPIYLAAPSSGGRAIVNQSCVDCRVEGGKLTKPSFWIDR